MAEYPQLLHTVLDTTRPRELAEFYRRLLGLRYRPGDEPPADGEPDDADWLVLVDADGRAQARLPAGRAPGRDDVARARRPDAAARRLHGLDRAELDRQRERAEALGAELLLDRTDDPDEPLYVFADPSGHPFCIFVA